MVDAEKGGRARTQFAVLRDEVHLAEHVDVRNLELEHGTEGE